MKVLSARVSEQAGHWYGSIQGEPEHVVPANGGPVVGGDRGVKSLATLSDGTVLANPKPLTRRRKKLQRLQRQRAVSRKVTGSNHRKKAAQQLAQPHRAVAQQRANTLPQLTSRLAKTKSVVVIEDLHVAGMRTNPHLAQAIAEGGGAEFRRQLVYKAAW